MFICYIQHFNYKNYNLYISNIYLQVRIPTAEGGNCVFWEFATDGHDIGFGVYFEWVKSSTSQVSVHVSESEEDDCDELEDDDDGNINQGIIIKYVF